MCISCYRHDTFRLRLADGRYVFMEWHRMFGPHFYRDRDCSTKREIELWYEDEMMCKAVDWFVERGKRA